MLRCEEVTLSYIDQELVHAIAGVSVAIEKGEFACLLGPSGSGKSSLLYLLSGLKKPSSGRVFFNDTDLWSLTEGKLAALRRRHFGFAFQSHFLMPYLSLLENVMVTAPDMGHKTRTRALELLERLGLGGKERRLPHQLSGGQRQRVAIARALLHRPDVLFADEPTASVDRGTALALMDVIRSEAGTLVLCTHDETLARGAHRILTMRDGQIVSDLSCKLEAMRAE